MMYVQTSIFWIDFFVVLETKILIRQQMCVMLMKTSKQQKLYYSWSLQIPQGLSDSNHVIQQMKTFWENMNRDSWNVEVFVTPRKKIFDSSILCPLSSDFIVNFCEMFNARLWVIPHDRVRRHQNSNFCTPGEPNSVFQHYPSKF